tara:strand:- start:190 stop:1557 length:1368 start_codon:yes stop_codon:yes gene_type:complete
MAYIFKFKSSDKVINLVKTFPKASFAFYGGNSYYNNQYSLSGAFTSSILGAPSGYTSLYEQSVDRDGTINFNDSELLNAQVRDPFGYVVSAEDPTATDPTEFYIGNNPTYAVFKVKDGTRINFKTVSRAEFNITEGGKPLHSTYPLTASLQKHYYPEAAPRYSASYLDLGPDTIEDTVDDLPVTGSVTYLYALKNTMNYYSVMSRNYQFSSSVRDLGASGSSPGATEVGLVTIPSIFYGDNIDKGTVNLKFYVTGTLIGELQDTNRNGDLIQIGPQSSQGSGSVAGVVLYKEGFIVLTGSWDLSNGAHTENYGTTTNVPSWLTFAQTISSSAPLAVSSSWALDFNGSHKVPTMTLFAHAKKGDLNHSNNPTYVDKNTQILLSSGSEGYTQNREALIANVVSSSFPDPTGSFLKTTYISKIGIYDKNKNLIGIAKLAKPVKKIPHRDFTFKIKLDI